MRFLYIILLFGLLPLFVQYAQAQESWQVVYDSGFTIDALYSDHDGIFYAGIGSVFRSTDDGITWEELGTGLPIEPQIQSVFKINNIILAGDRQFGLFKLTGQTSSVNNSEQTAPHFSLHQNYPNPFNPLTTISFSVSESGFIVLTVLDILGREIETLINQELPPGLYETQWNGSNQSSGIYFYRLSNDLSSEIKKFVLLR